MLLEAWNGVDAAHCAALLLHKGRTLHGGAPWSLAELRLDEADFRKLESWARSPHQAGLQRRLAGTSFVDLPQPCDGLAKSETVVFGLVLLAFFSECVARDGSVDEVWPSIARKVRNAPLHDEVFGDGRAARAVVREALREAASQLSLRHSEGLGPENYWHRLLLLHAGFTVRDTPRLGGWLLNPAGGTFLIGALSDASDFANAWSALGHVARGGARDSARAAVRACPFFRGPVGEVLESAVQAASGGRVGPRPHAAGAVLGGGPDDAPGEVGGEADGFLTVTWALQWPIGGAPELVLTPSLAPDETLGRRAAVLVDGVQRGTMLLTGAGRFALFGAAEVRVPLTESLVVSVRASAAVDPVEISVLGDEAVAWFDAEGRRCGAASRTVSWLVARGPVRVVGGRSTWVAEAGLSVAAVGQGVEVYEEDGGRWWPVDEGATLPRDTSLGLDVRLTEVAGDEVSWRVGHASGATIARAFMGSTALRVVSSGHDEVTVTGRVPAWQAAPEMRLTLRGEVGGRLVQQTIGVRAFTRASLDGAWVDPAGAIEAERLRCGAVRVALGEEFARFDARLRGRVDRLALTVGGRRAPRAPVLGYGEPLEVAGDDPWVDGATKCLLATRVEDHGVLAGHEVSGGEVRLALRCAIGVDAAEHGVVVWSRDGNLRAIAIDRVEGGTVIARHEGRAPRAVALCFGSAVLGASWASDWSNDLPACKIDGPTLVRVVRVLCLPFLASEHEGAFVAALRARDLGASLAACIEPSRDAVIALAPPEGRTLIAPGDDERWPAAVRWLVLSLRFGTQAEVDAFAKGATAKVMRAHPPPTYEPGRPYTDEMRRAVRSWNVRHGHVFQSAALTLGAVHPADAADLLANSGREAVRLADVAMSVSYERVCEDAALARKVRRDQLAALRGRQMPGFYRVLLATKAWARSAPPAGWLQVALADRRLAECVQIELLVEKCEWHRRMQK